MKRTPTGPVCACGCGNIIGLDGPSADFAGWACQARWNRARSDTPPDPAWPPAPAPVWPAPLRALALAGFLARAAWQQRTRRAAR